MNTPAGDFVVKLRGAAQGIAPLIAEVLAGEIATELGLPVPDRALIELDDSTPTDDHNDELADLLRASHGLNLGFRLLQGAQDLRIDQLARIPTELASGIVWFDGLIVNPDRTTRNPNILLWHGQPWLIDHGAALSFHYDWRNLHEQLPREPGITLTDHLLFARATELERIDTEWSHRLDRNRLTQAAARVPAPFLSDAFPGELPERLRAAYVAFLWKRLKEPRPFMPR